MLNDRNYMRGGARDDFDRSGLTALYGLIVVNILFFLLLPSARHPELCLSMPGIRQGLYWEVVTAMFMHANFWHILFNMYSLYLFGGMIAPRLGAKRFLALYFTAGIAGNLLWLASESFAGPAGLLLGASGAVMGVIAASAMMEPDVRLFILFIPYPVKLRTMAMVFFGLDVFNEIFAGPAAGVAYLAHIGGFLVGAAFAAVFFKGFVRWNPFSFLTGGGRAPRGWGGGPRAQGNPPPGWAYTTTDAPRPNPGSFSRGGRVSQQELDHLLDKISRDGINSLTEEELARLRLAREQMRGR